MSFANLTALLTTAAKSSFAGAAVRSNSSRSNLSEFNSSSSTFSMANHLLPPPKQQQQQQVGQDPAFDLQPLGQGATMQRMFQSFNTNRSGLIPSGSRVATRNWSLTISSNRGAVIIPHSRLLNSSSALEAMFGSVRGNIEAPGESVTAGGTRQSGTKVLRSSSLVDSSRGPKTPMALGLASTSNESAAIDDSSVSEASGDSAGTTGDSAATPGPPISDGDNVSNADSSTSRIHGIDGGIIVNGGDSSEFSSGGGFGDSGSDGGGGTRNGTSDSSGGNPSDLWRSLLSLFIVFAAAYWGPKYLKRVAVAVAAAGSPKQQQQQQQPPPVSAETKSLLEPAESDAKVIADAEFKDVDDDSESLTAEMPQTTAGVTIFEGRGYSSSSASQDEDYVETETEIMAWEPPGCSAEVSHSIEQQKSRQKHLVEAAVGVTAIAASAGAVFWAKKRYQGDKKGKRA